MDPLDLQGLRGSDVYFALAHLHVKEHKLVACVVEVALVLPARKPLIEHRLGGVFVLGPLRGPHGLASPTYLFMVLFFIYSTI